MLLVRYTTRFIRMYKDLDPNLKDEVKEKISLFQGEHNHSRLKVHKLKNIENTYSFSINYKIRIIFEYVDKNTVNFLLVGSHDEVYE